MDIQYFLDPFIFIYGKMHCHVTLPHWQAGFFQQESNHGSFPRVTCYTTTVQVFEWLLHHVWCLRHEVVLPDVITRSLFMEVIVAVIYGVRYPFDTYNCGIPHFHRSTACFHTTTNQSLLCSLVIQPLALHLTTILLGIVSWFGIT